MLRVMNAQELVNLVRLRRMLANGTAKRTREAAGVSFHEAADVVDVAPSTIYRWENLERAPHGEAALRYFDLLQELMTA